MAAEEQVAEMEEVLESAFAPAFRRCPDLHPLSGSNPDGINPLGLDPEDWLVYNLLVSAGITVELLDEDREEAMRYHAMQIVTKNTLDYALEVNDSRKIKLADKDEMLGLQVKLCARHKWRITVVDKNLEHHVTHATGRRSRSITEQKSTIIENKTVCEILRFAPKGDLKCTAAYMHNVTINIAFKTSSDLDDAGANAESIWGENGWPLIAQRRIDAVFSNRFLIACQVCSASQNTFRNANREARN